MIEDYKVVGDRLVITYRGGDGAYRDYYSGSYRCGRCAEEKSRKNGPCHVIDYEEKYFLCEGCLQQILERYRELGRGMHEPPVFQDLWPLSEERL